jgi:universal stress protein A
MTPRTIVVATDFSEQAEKATRYAIDLARRLDARVHLVHAWLFPPITTPEVGGPLVAGLINDLEREAAKALELALARYSGAGIPVEGTVVTNDPRDGVVDAAAKLGADLIVVGTHGRRGLTRALLGSVAESIVRSATCPVLVVR